MRLRGGSDFPGAARSAPPRRWSAATPHAGPKEHDTRPAIDPLFVSAAAAFGPRVVGVLLSGTGADGARGLIAIKAAGGLSLAQSPDEAQYPAMPRNAVAHDRVSAALPAWEPAARAARAGARRALHAPRILARSSGDTGLTRCASNPASRARRRSSG